MAGEIAEPISLDFKADSFLSGSISFGRFESEVLCWERRSSFSHNRYLEEVEKCSKPGSVTEKKAYFEAQFRKKRILGLSSPCSQSETVCESSDNEKTGYDDESTHTNVGTLSPQLDKRLDRFGYASQHEELFSPSNLDSQIEHSCDNSTRNIDFLSECREVEDESHVKPERVLSIFSEPETEVKEALDLDPAKLDTIYLLNPAIGLTSDNHAVEENRDASPKSQEGKVPLHGEDMKPKLEHGVGVSQTRRGISGKEMPKGSEKRYSKTVYNVPMRSESEKKTVEAQKHEAKDKCTKQKTQKHELGSKAKNVDEIKRCEKESRIKRVQMPQSSAPRDVPTRVRQSENRMKPAVGTPQRCLKQDSSRFGFKCNERTERRKQFDMKMEEKMNAREAEKHQTQTKTQEKTEAEIKQLRKRLNFKATPLPSFYRELGRNKVTNKIAKPQQGISKDKVISALPKAIDSQQVFEATSCHSTVTSDSSSSSPAAEISKLHHSKAVASRKEKLTNANKIHKGRAVGKQK